MRIAVDARMMGAGKTRGIGRYIEETVKAMKVLAPDIDFVLLAPDIRWYALAEQFKMPKVIREAEADLLWVPHWNVSFFYRGPFVITVHDLLLLHQPASARASTRGPAIAWLKRLGYRAVLSSAIRRARVIFVPTHAVADDIKKYFPHASERVVITGEGLSNLEEDASSIRPSERYLLHVGSAYPHKRLDLLLDVWKRLASGHPDLHLYLAGASDVFSERLDRRIKTESIPRVIQLGPVSDATLAALYANAEAFVFPTSFEGFGLPPLEALSFGTPVIASDIPVLREVLPEKGVFFFKNGSADDMMRVIETVLADAATVRAQAAQGGEEARRRWSWEDVARKTLEGLRRAVDRT